MSMSKDKKESISLRSYLGLAVVCLVVVGVAFLAMKSQPNKPTDATVQKTTDNVKPGQSKQKAVAVFKDGRMHLRSLDNSLSKEIKWPDDVSRLNIPLSQMRGVGLGSGSVVWLGPGFVQASSTVFRSPDGRREAYLANDRRDGTGAVNVVQGRENMTLVLRQSNGRKITDEAFLGWLDKDTLVFSGIATSTKVFLTLDINGTMRILANMPDDAWLARVSDGKIYFARATPGEGIESPQQPPSSIWSVGPDGRMQMVSDEPRHVIQDFQVVNGMLAFSLEDGRLSLSRDGKTADLGKGRPLGISGEVIVCEKDGKYGFVDQEGKWQTIEDVDPSATLFYLPNAALD